MTVIRSSDSSRIQDNRPRDTVGNIIHTPASTPSAGWLRTGAGKATGTTPPAYGITPDKSGSLFPSATPRAPRSMGATGLNGSYGTNTAMNPARQVGRPF